MKWQLERLGYFIVDAEDSRAGALVLNRIVGLRDSWQGPAGTARGQGKALDEEIRRLIGAAEEADIEAYWQRVEANLRAGKVRLVFAADEEAHALRICW